MLWFHPTVVDPTSITTAEVETRHLPTLAAGQQEPTLDAARQYIDRLVAEQQAALAAARPQVPAQPQPQPRTTPPSTT